MDPITQGVLGATASKAVAKPHEAIVASLLGFLAGMAADLDVLIKSNTDPLLALEYHRQFTHSLVFIPLGALICAVCFHYLFSRKTLSFTRSYLFCLAGYATHALLDACTTYGTQLFWPFSSTRFAWNNVSVVDPLFTLPLALLAGLAIYRRAPRLALAGMLYALMYLALGVVQNHRALAIANELAASRGHQALSIDVKPSFANIVVWKSVYQHAGRYYVDAIRVLRDRKVIEGSSTQILDVDQHFPWLDSASQQARDIQRFAWFSNQHLAIDPNNPNRIIDVRYSLIPNRLDGMWGIVLKQNAKSQEHVRWTTTRPNRQNMAKNMGLLWAMIMG